MWSNGVKPMAAKSIPVSIRGRKEVPYALRQLANARDVDVADIVRHAVEQTYGEEFFAALKKYKTVEKKRSEFMELA